MYLIINNLLSVYSSLHLVFVEFKFTLGSHVLYELLSLEISWDRIENTRNYSQPYMLHLFQPLCDRVETFHYIEN